MTDSIDSALGIHAQALALRARRAEILAANMANANTPGYKARDLDFRAALLAAQQASPADGPLLARTAAGHMGDDTGSAAAGAGALYVIPRQASLDGNSVDTQREHAEFVENAIRYEASLTILGGRIRSLLVAIRGE